MSKSSRRKKPSQQETPHDPETEAGIPEADQPASGEEARVTEDAAPSAQGDPVVEENPGEVSEGTSEEVPPEDIREGEESGLPESVPGEALAGEAPRGEVPPLPLVLEAILFASQKAVTPKELAAHLRNAASAEPTSVAAAFARIRESDVASALIDLQAEVAAAGRAYQVRETATGWILSSGPGFAPWLRALYPEAKPTRLSPSALETLAIIAYRQPITRADMEAVRGVSVDGVMQTLLDRGLVKIAGRAEVAGRPLLYATTQFFLDHFGLRHLDELPNASELRSIPLPQATPEPAPESGAEGAGAELPLADEAGNESAEASPEPTGESPDGAVEVTEILEIRESVVFEEVLSEAVENEPADESLPEQETPAEPSTEGEEPVA
jgi:segregation and condensation protein B